jgi:altronate hydrolase
MPPVPLSEVAIHLRPTDNVAVAGRVLAPGLEVQFDGCSLTVAQRIGFGHKVAVRLIRAGEPVVKYGQTIGLASADIALGTHVHVHKAPTGRTTFATAPATISRSSAR